jgi:hypothetical protein
MLEAAFNMEAGFGGGLQYYYGGGCLGQVLIWRQFFGQVSTWRQMSWASFNMEVGLLFTGAIFLACKSKTSYYVQSFFNKGSST